jgi:uncharacterized repeat protein (TIGR03943 family)
VNRETENALLLVLGLSTGAVTVTGTFTRYVRPTLLPWLAALAVLLVGLALAAIFFDRRNAPASVEHHHDGHPHRNRLAWLLAVPVVIMGFVMPPALGANAAISERAVTVSAQELRRPFAPLPPGRAPEVSLKDVLNRVRNDSAGTLNGRDITVSGFVLLDSGSVQLARFAIFCCAADAQVARLHLMGPAAPAKDSFPENTWLRVEGRIVPLPPDPPVTFVPDLIVSGVTRIDPPDNHYSY